MPRSSVYVSARLVAEPAVEPRPAGAKRGPKTKHSDAEVGEEIRNVLRNKELPRRGTKEGHPPAAEKAHPRRQEPRAALDAGEWIAVPVRRWRERGDRTHSGTIRTERPDELWGTDATMFYTEQDGWCWFFGVINHCTDEITGWHVAKKGDRWAALEPIRQGVEACFGTYAPKIALGLGLRHDWGPQYTARQFNAELKWTGMRSSPAFVGEPECNGLIERFMRTLKEECIYVRRFETLDEALGERIHPRYNAEGLLERHGYRTPAEVRQEFTELAA